MILTLALVAINAWNRMSIAFRTVPGAYRPSMHAATSLSPRAWSCALSHLNPLVVERDHLREATRTSWRRIVVRMLLLSVAE